MVVVSYNGSATSSVWAPGTTCCWVGWLVFLELGGPLATCHQWAVLQREAALAFLIICTSYHVIAMQIQRESLHVAVAQAWLVCTQIQLPSGAVAAISTAQPRACGRVITAAVYHKSMYKCSKMQQQLLCCTRQPGQALASLNVHPFTSQAVSCLKHSTDQR